MGVTFPIADYNDAVIGRGNLVSSNMIGRHIRAHSETSVFGAGLPAGQLQQYDLDQFRDYGYRVPGYLVNVIHAQEKDWSGWLYIFFHWGARGAKTVDGWVLTSLDHTLKAFTVATGNEKSWDTIQQLCKIVAEE